MAEPEVGIYWFYEDKIFYEESVPVSHGDLDGDFINGNSDHSKIWDSLYRLGFMDSLPVELREDYTSIPRGRVLYSVKEDQYIIYHGDSFTEKEYCIIRDTFFLPERITTHKIARHYHSLMSDL